MNFTKLLKLKFSFRLETNKPMDRFETYTIASECSQSLFCNNRNSICRHSEKKEKIKRIQPKGNSVSTITTPLFFRFHICKNVSEMNMYCVVSRTRSLTLHSLDNNYSINKSTVSAFLFVFLVALLFDYLTWV